MLTVSGIKKRRLGCCRYVLADQGSSRPAKLTTGIQLCPDISCELLSV